MKPILILLLLYIGFDLTRELLLSIVNFELAKTELQEFCSRVHFSIASVSIYSVAC